MGDYRAAFLQRLKEDAENIKQSAAKLRLPEAPPETKINPNEFKLGGKYGSNQGA